MRPDGVKISRRTFIALTGTTATGVALAACAPISPTAGSATNTTASKTAAGSASTAGTIKRGGTLTWAQVQDNANVDPALITGAAQSDIARNVFDSLVALDADTKIHPWLATSWTVEDNAQKYTFKLRDDVKFHDGTALDSTAVKRTLERVADPRTKGAQAATALGPLDRAEAPDPRTVVMYFKSPNPLLLLQLWRSWYGIISPKQLDTLNPGDVIKSPIGSGPYKFGGISADGVVTLQANPDYKWAPSFITNRSGPHLEGLRFRRVAEASTRTATLQSGEHLLVDDVAEGDYSRLKDDSRFTFVQVGRKGPGYGFQFNLQKAPASDIAVRQAINWSVDRQAIVDRLFFGVHKPCVGPLTEGVWGRLDELESTIPYAGDKKKAADILDAAGWKVNQAAGGIREKDGQRLSMMLASVTGSLQNDLADALQLQVREIGVDLQIQKLPINNWLEVTRSYRHDMCDTAGANFDPDELRQRYHSTSIGAVNYANLSDPTLDDLLVKGQNQPLGSDERRQTYAAIQRRLMDLMPMVAMITLVKTQGMSSRLRSYQMDGSGLYPYAMVDTWLDS